MMDFGIGEKQAAEPGGRDFGKIVENARPELRHERTFIDSVNELRVHESLSSRPCATSLPCMLACFRDALRHIRDLKRAGCLPGFGALTLVEHAVKLVGYRLGQGAPSPC